MAVHMQEKDLDALQYTWYVEYDEEKHGPPQPLWELDMRVEVETAIHAGRRYTTTTFSSASNPDAWIKTGRPINLTQIR